MSLEYDKEVEREAQLGAEKAARTTLLLSTARLLATNAFEPRTMMRPQCYAMIGIRAC